MKRIKILSYCLAVVVALAPASCDDNGDDKQSDASDLGAMDQTVGSDQQIPADDTSVPSDQQAPPGDTGTATDQQVPTGDINPPDGVTDVPNSGAICGMSTPCPSPGEECIYFDAASGKGMCLGPCENKGDLCPVDNYATQLSVCAVTGLTPNTWFCAWMCEIGGKTYTCPNDTDYKCVQSENGVAKFCQPK
jgi:hypothetical protein